MIEIDNVVSMVRWKEQDTDEVRFSDYEILHAINEVLRYLTNRLANQQSDVLEREQDFRQEETGEDYARDGAMLPEDFISIKGIYRLSDHYRLHAVSDDHVHEDSFRLFAGRIYAKCDFRLQYYGSPGEAVAGGFVLFPSSFLDALVKLTRLVLNNGDVDTLTQAVNDEVAAIVPRRKYNNLRPKMPWSI